ncbi:hypothetical protein L1987_14235 [Smallanthus sonchifolius]|uniref:Uncharacterized protein n=1 Tax=Smallanthus sonchifolius TaxID=185202 RepID=A0ACB9J4U3_9ASTR|nr:hypothetical protein L1987_14235 [Smallanthus sonchifolius]
MEDEIRSDLRKMGIRQSKFLVACQGEGQEYEHVSQFNLENQVYVEKGFENLRIEYRLMFKECKRFSNTEAKKLKKQFNKNAETSTTTTQELRAMSDTIVSQSQQARAEISRFGVALLQKHPN